MNIKDYMEEVAKECEDLTFEFSNKYIGEAVVNNNDELIIYENGDCNYDTWNNGWLKNNIKEFNEVGIKLVHAQELFPNPKDFVKFYEKVIKEIENEK